MQRKTSTFSILPCLFLFLLSAEGLLAQSLQIRGQVLDAEAGNPLSGATITLSEGRQYAISDELGKFVFKDVQSGSHRLSVSYLGYEKQNLEIQATAGTDLKIRLQPAPVKLEEVNIQGSQNLTQSNKISGVDRQLRPVNSAQDLLQLVPGLMIAQHAGGGKAEQIFLRGFDSDHGTDFQISVDGMPVNMVSHAHGQGYADFHFVIPETVDKLQVFKGPYTARFGDFATSGTGEFLTKNALENSEIKLEAGRFDTYRALGMFNLLGRDKHLLSKQPEHAYVAAEYVFTNAYFDDKQKFGRYNLFGKYTGMLNEHHYLSFSASTFSARWNASGQVPQRAIDAGQIDRFGSIDPTEGGQTARSNINAILSSTLKNQALMKHQLYYVHYYFNLYSNFTFFLENPIDGDGINQTDRRHIAGYNGSYEQSFRLGGKALQTSFGLGTRNDFSDVSLKHSVKRMVTDTIVSGRVAQNNSNAYADATLALTRQFSINAGLRFDYFRFGFNESRRDSLSGKKALSRTSPKLSFAYTLNPAWQFFLKSGIGFHSNDARSVVLNQTENSLPRAYGSEIGLECKPAPRLLIHAALWALYLESELVYVGDGGVVETSTPTRRLGADLSLRWQVSGKLYADLDLNYNYGRLVGAPDGENRIPLAPGLTSIGGLSYKQERGFNASLRYRYIDSRPANESNSVEAKGYCILDLLAQYRWARFDLGFSIENLLNTSWNQAQFDTESRLFDEAEPVSELHFTPGTPFFIKGMLAFKF